MQINGGVLVTPEKTRQLLLASKVDQFLARPPHLVPVTVEEYALCEGHGAPVCTTEFQHGRIQQANAVAE